MIVTVTEYADNIKTQCPTPVDRLESYFNVSHCH